MSPQNPFDSKSLTKTSPASNATNLTNQSPGFVTPPNRTSQAGEIPPTPNAPLSRPQRRAGRVVSGSVLSYGADLTSPGRNNSNAYAASIGSSHCATCTCVFGPSLEIDLLKQKIHDLEVEIEQLRAAKENLSGERNDSSQ